MQANARIKLRCNNATISIKNIKNCTLVCVEVEERGNVFITHNLNNFYSVYHSLPCKTRKRIW